MNIQNYLELTTTKFLLQDTALTAGGTVVAATAEIDRFGTYADADGDFTNKYDLNTLTGIAILDGAVADGETLALNCYLQTSDVSGFGSDVNYVDAAGDLSTSAPTTTGGFSTYSFTGATAVAVTFDDILDIKAYLKSCKRYVRLYFSATFSAGSTDTVSLAVAATLGDSQNNVIDVVDVKDVVAD